MKLFQNVKWVFMTLVFLAIASLNPLKADIKMPRIFSDNMVLQRNAEVIVWGQADPSERISVSIAGQSHSVRATRQGDWSVKLSPEKEGGPHILTVKGKNMLTFSNVLFGEVWICSGQSNMEWPLNRSGNAEEEIQLADYPEIRLFTVPRRMSTRKENDIEGGEWQVCTPDNAGSFSAVGYFFGRYLHKELNVPVGLINSSWGGTVVETWISPEVMAQDIDFAEIMGIGSGFDLDRMRAEAEKRARDWAEKIEENDLGRKNSWQIAGTDDASWPVMELPVLWEQAGLPNLDGIVWYRKSFTLSADQASQPLIINLGPVDDSDYTYINGSLIGETIDRYDQNRRYNVDASHLKAGENVIAVRVIDTGGGGGLWGEPAQLYVLTGHQRIPLDGPWKYAVGVKTEAPPSVQRLSGPNSFPSLLYNGMIHPIIPYTLQGAIWYQGESNAGRAYQYRRLFPALINDWRNQWGKPDMPFLFVQLANFMAADNKPVDSQWAELREAQSMTLSLPYTGQAVAIDIGEADDIHPTNKQDVGKRLALPALKIAYGKELVFSGPVYESMLVEGNSIRLKFSNTGSGLEIKDKYGYLKGFAIAGEDKVFHWALAKLDGNEIIVSSSMVKKPVAVRYAWGNNPDDANLYNKEGLPASPFRTDTWPGITEGSK